MRLLKKAHESEIDDHIWQLYVALYPKMTPDNAFSFSEFKKYFEPTVEKDEKTVLEQTKKALEALSEVN